MQGVVAWFVRNPVASNLLMSVMCVAGLLAFLTVHQEEFPEINTQMVNITVPYLGAAPEESEQGVCIRIEEAIEGVEGRELAGDRGRISERLQREVVGELGFGHLRRMS